MCAELGGTPIFPAKLVRDRYDGSHETISFIDRRFVLVERCGILCLKFLDGSHCGLLPVI